MKARTIWGLCVVGLAACGGRGESVEGDASSPAAAQAAEAPAGVVSEGDAELAQAPDDAELVGSGPIRAVSPALPEPASPEPASPEPASPEPVPWGPYEGAEPAPAEACPDTYPETGWAPEPWEPLAASGPAQLLQAVQAALPGQWRGQVTTPWTTPYLVDLTFGADGSYSGRCSELSSVCCQAFYYGSDEDTPIKRYRVEDATLSGEVFGEIDIAFAYGDEYGLPAWQGELSHIATDASGNGLRFRFERSDGYGPVEYDLRRVTEP